jgi:hypothetical protein|tara:strand:- start:2880 stop:4937 length:2058 start_codon:yes stop_codon:yes gene_type:complete
MDRFRSHSSFYRIKILFFTLIVLLFSSIIALGQSISINSPITIDFNTGISGTTDVAYIGNSSGNNQYAYSINVSEGNSVAFTIDANSLTGDPKMQIIMFNPSNNIEYWDATDPVDIVQGSNTISWGEGGFSGNVHLKFAILLDADDAVALDSFIVTDSGDGLPSEYSDFYTPSNVVSYGNNNFTFGQNSNTGEAISWQQEVNYNPYNGEIQDYVRGKVGIDDSDNLVLRIDRTGSNTYYSSRVNTQIYSGIRLGSGQKLSVEFEAQLPMAKNSSGNYVPNVPLWPALWLMGNDQLNNQWVGWPFCAEIDVMEWSPTKPPQQSASGYETQANVAYHWNGADQPSGYNHWQTAEYYDNDEMHTTFHKWRVDIYRYDDGINTNKIEIFMNDVYISGSRFYDSDGMFNKEFWYPTTNKNPQLLGSGDKEYFLIMNIALGGVYSGSDNEVPSQFDHAEMVVKSVTYQVSGLERFTLDLSYDIAKISVTRSPDEEDYQYNTPVLVEATPFPGYVLGNSDWVSNTIVMDENKSLSISSYPDFSDDDGDGLNNYNEAVIYNSNLNSADSDNDNTSDYFESIAGTSLTDPSDYFYMQGSMNTSGLYNLEYSTKSSREYSISVSDDLVNWYNWKTESGDNATHTNIFDPSIESILGLNSNSDSLFFKVDIEEAHNATGPGGGPSGPGGPGGPGGP